jgi:hypothetical protein
MARPGRRGIQFCLVHGTDKEHTVSTFFNDLVLPAALWALGSTQSLTEMSTENLPRGKDRRRVRLTISPPSVNRLPRENVGASMSHSPTEFHSLLQE